MNSWRANEDATTSERKGRPKNKNGRLLSALESVDWDGGFEENVGILG